MPPAIIGGGIAAAGALGSAAIASGGSGGSNKPAKKAQALASQAPGTIQAGEQAYLSSPLYQGALQWVQSLLQNPQSLTPEVTEGIKTNASNKAQHAAQDSLTNLHTRASGVGSGFRSGSTRGMEAEVSAKLGSDIGNANRQVDLMAAQQRIPDLINAVQLAMSLQNQQSQWPRDIANAQLGGAGVIGGLPQQPSWMQGFGALSGNVLSGMAQGGAFNNMFGGSGGSASATAT